MPSKVDNVLVLLHMIGASCDSMKSLISHTTKTRDVSDASVGSIVESIQTDLGRIAERLSEIERIGISSERFISNEDSLESRTESVKMLSKQILECADYSKSTIKAGAAEILMEEALFFFTEGD